MPEPIRCLESTLAPLPIDNVDTDQIIPASFLKTTVRQGLSRGLFAGWRTAASNRQESTADGTAEPPFVLDDPRYRGAQILVAGDNFGCGSSREHAPWALLDHGIRAVLSTRFADIFRQNALGNGLLAVELPSRVHAELMAIAQEDREARLRIDVERCQVRTPYGELVPFELEPFRRHCLLEGVDTLGYLISRLPEVEAYEVAAGPGLPRTTTGDFDTRRPFEDGEGASP